MHGSKAAKSKSFRDYVEWRMQPSITHTIRNYQTLYLAGNHGLASEAEISTHYFNDALDAVRGDALIGLVERYDESMVVLEENLKGSFANIDLSYVVQNASEKKPRNESSNESVAATLEELGDLQRTEEPIPLKSWTQNLKMIQICHPTQQH